MPTQELLYVSDRPSTTTDEQVVDGIVMPSMRKNRELGITGCLWFGKTRFVQILEGEREAIDDLYAKIERDDRHHDVRLIHYGPIESRAFDRWSMRLIKGDERDTVESIIAEYAVGHADTEDSSEPVGAAVFTSIRRKLRALADVSPFPIAGH